MRQGLYPLLLSYLWMSGAHASQCQFTLPPLPLPEETPTSIGQEKRMGNDLVKSVRTAHKLPGITPTVIEDKILSRYLESISRRILTHAPRYARNFQYRFVFAVGVGDQMLAYPGGTILIYLGFLSRAQTDDYVATLLSHEIAHIALRHITVAGSEIPDSKSILRQEFNADVFATRIAGSAGFGARSTVAYWVSLGSEEEIDHPSNTTRACLYGLGQIAVPERESSKFSEARNRARNILLEAGYPPDIIFSPSEY